MRNIEIIGEWLLTAPLTTPADGVHIEVSGVLANPDCTGYQYPEAGGYYLTLLAYMAGSDPLAGARLEVLASSVVRWLGSLVRRPSIPTRIYVDRPHSDWRNQATFSFDVAMVIRGLCAAQTAFGINVETTLRKYSAVLKQFFVADGPISAYVPTSERAHPPTRWSTCPGPYHLKAVTAVLMLPPQIRDTLLSTGSRSTLDHWLVSRPAWPDYDLHPTLYSLEGLVQLDHLLGRPSYTILAASEYLGLLKNGMADELLGAHARSDVIAQALRLGVLLADRLQALDTHALLARLSERLSDHIGEDGSVSFRSDRTLPQELNAWCAMFTYQALHYYRNFRRGLPTASGDVLHLI